eukprot:scaffold8084_cov305-Pinguiococcus_pyrenoidosus.AAC.2
MPSLSRSQFSENAAREAGSHGHQEQSRVRARRHARLHRLRDPLGAERLWDEEGRGLRGRPRHVHRAPLRRGLEGFSPPGLHVNDAQSKRKKSPPNPLVDGLAVSRQLRVRLGFHAPLLVLRPALGAAAARVLPELAQRGGQQHGPAALLDAVQDIDFLGQEDRVDGLEDGLLRVGLDARLPDDRLDHIHGDAVPDRGLGHEGAVQDLRRILLDGIADFLERDEDQGRDAAGID